MEFSERFMTTENLNKNKWKIFSSLTMLLWSLNSPNCFCLFDFLPFILSISRVHWDFGGCFSLIRFSFSTEIICLLQKLDCGSRVELKSHIGKYCLLSVNRDRVSFYVSISFKAGAECWTSNKSSDQIFMVSNLTTQSNLIYLTPHCIPATAIIILISL